MFYNIVALFKFYRRRFMLSLIGIAVGIGAITALVALNGIVKKNAQEFIQRIGGSRFVLNIMAPSEKILKDTLGYEQVVNFVTSFNKAFTIVPYKIMGMKSYFELKNIEAITIATTSDIFTNLQWQIQQGRKLHVLDKEDKVVVIGANVAQRLEDLGVKNCIGQLIYLEGHYFSIIGVLQAAEFNPILDFDVNDAILFDLNLLARFEKNAILDSFIVQGKKWDLKTTENKLKQQLMLHLGKTRFYFRDALMFEQALFKQVTLTMKILTIIAAITLFLGVVSILNLLFIMVEERKMEIGLRISVGATISDIRKQFLFETLALCVAGGSVGILLGQLLAYIIVCQLEITYYPQLVSWIIAFPVSLLLGLIIGLIPANMAAKLDPVKLIHGA